MLTSDDLSLVLHKLNGLPFVERTAPDMLAVRERLEREYETRRLLETALD
jgi:hypothetical protein